MDFQQPRRRSIVAGPPAKAARGSRGFSLLEMMVVLAIGLIVSSIAFITLQPSFKEEQVAAAFNSTLMTMRRARQLAVDQRKTFVVSFIAPQTIQVQRMDAGVMGPIVSQSTLPRDMQFLNLAGIPNTTATTPDGFGTGSNAIDFDIDVGGGAGTTIYFKPDGGAYDLAGNTNNGVVYIARPNEILSSRAITLFGTTGRMRGWRLWKNQQTGTMEWQQL